MMLSTSILSDYFVVLIVRKILPVSKWWILADPLIMAGIGTVLELIPLLFNGLNSGFETLGWMLMFVCGIKHIELLYVYKEGD